MKTFFFFLLLCGTVYAEGPVFRHKDPAVQQEFENVYQDGRKTSSYKTYIAKAYVNFDGSGGATSIRNAVNVSSVAYVSAGVYKLTFSPQMLDSKYSVSVTAAGYAGNFVFAGLEQTTNFSPTVSQVQVKVMNVAGATVESNIVSVVVFGNQ